MKGTVAPPGTRLVLSALAGSIPTRGHPRKFKTVVHLPGVSEQAGAVDIYVDAFPSSPWDDECQCCAIGHECSSPVERW